MKQIVVEYLHWDWQQDYLLSFEQSYKWQNFLDLLDNLLLFLGFDLLHIVVDEYEFKYDDGH